MELGKKKEITKKAAELAIKNPSLSMRALAREVGGTTSTTLKKFFDTILPEYYPDLALQIKESKELFQKKSEEEKYHKSRAYQKRRRELVKIEEANEVAEYIIRHHATMKQASSVFARPIANLQRSLNLLRKENAQVRQDLDRVFAENKNNYYQKLGTLTKERISMIRKCVDFINHHPEYSSLLIKSLHIFPIHLLSLDSYVLTSRSLTGTVSKERSYETVAN